MKTLPYHFKFCDKKVTFNSESIQPKEIPDKKLFKISEASLDVSGTCNMNCNYCAEKMTLPLRSPISKEMLPEMIDIIFQWFSTSKKISIRIGSGEPLLQSKVVHEIGTRSRFLAQKSNQSLDLFLTTNGTLLNDSICKWLIDDNWNVKISLDGSAQIHNQNRGAGTFEKIEKYIRLFAITIPEKFSTTSVLYHGIDPSDVFDNIAALGVKQIEMVPVAAESASSFLLLEEDVEKYRIFITNYVKRLSRGDSLPTLLRFLKKIQRVLGLRTSRVYCGAGRNFLIIGADGLIYPCYRFLGLERFQIGSVTEGINEKSLFNFQSNVAKPYDKHEKCRICWAAPLCGGACFANTALLYSKDGEPPSTYCQLIKAESEAAIWLVQKLRKKNPERLIDILGLHLNNY